MRLPPKLITRLQKYPKVQAIYLFGSHARKDAGPLSDIDICVIAFGVSEKMKYDILGHASDKVDLVLFEDLPLTIRVRVFKEGRVLFVRNKRLLDDLMWRTMKEFFDFTSHRIRLMDDYLPGVAHE